MTEKVKSQHLERGAYVYVLDLFMWISYRCFTARGRERGTPLFGDFGLASQLGSVSYARPRPNFF
jgi:hypothetical protein